MTSEESSVSFEAKTPEELRRFFRANKDKYQEIWIILTKKTHADPQPVPFNEAVAEAVKRGLIGSRTKTLNERKYAIRFTKRKKIKPSLAMR